MGFPPPKSLRKKFLISPQIAMSPSLNPPTGLATAGFAAGAAAGASPAAAGAPSAAGAAAGAPSAAIVSCRQSANCWVRCFEISGSRPRESCAAAPVSVMSACIFTVVWSPSPGSSQEVTVAFAAPLPLASMPLAFSTTRWASSSRDSIVTEPANDIETGPNFAFSLPFQLVSSTTSVSSAPGMQGAIFSTSRRVAQSTSGGVDTVNSFSISMVEPAYPLVAPRKAAGSALNRSRHPAEQK